MKKLYFAPAIGESPLTFDEVVAVAEYEGIKEITVQVAKPYTVPGVAWCHEYDATIFDEERPETCNKDCLGYTPANGKFGKCKNYTRRFWEPSGKEITIKL